MVASRQPTSSEVGRFAAAHGLLLPHTAAECDFGVAQLSCNLLDALAGCERRRWYGANIRYVVVGLGHLAQVAVLPAFAKARNSELATLVYDPVRLAELSNKYSVEPCYNYAQYEQGLAGGEVDAACMLKVRIRCIYLGLDRAAVAFASVMQVNRVHSPAALKG